MGAAADGPGAVDSSAGRRSTPVRTCVGCRERAAKPDLLRVVVVRGSLVPDLRGRLPGRGAYVHPRAECVALAVRRRAFPRALRSSGPLDTATLEAHVRAAGEAPAGRPDVRSSDGKQVDNDEQPSMSSR